MRIILGKSQVCNMTMFSGALNKPAFDGNTFLHKISEENGMHEYVYNGGDIVCSFSTNDILYEYVVEYGKQYMFL